MIPLLYKSENFLTLDKPHNTLTIPGRFPGKEDCPVLSHVVAQEQGVRLWPVHRLDREVSGVLLFALTAEAHRAANEWFEKKGIRKTYEALTESVSLPTGTTKKWTSLLVRGKKRAYERPFGKLSTTLATFQGNREISGNTYGLWSLKPETGRPHQLRYELSKHGFPILGDALYGSNAPIPKKWAIALRATEIDFRSCENAKQFGLPEEIRASGIVEWIESPA